MVSEAPSDLTLTTLPGQSHTLPEWLTTFHLVTVLLDPFTSESAWLLPSVARILRTYDEADCRVALVATCTPEEATQFLGPYAKEFLTFADPQRTFVKGLGVERLPAIVHIRQDLSVAGAAEGWDPGRHFPHGGNQMSLALVAGLGLGGCEAYPGFFGAFGGYADDCEVSGGWMPAPQRPGIGFEGQEHLHALMREVARDWC